MTRQASSPEFHAHPAEQPFCSGLPARHHRRELPTNARRAPRLIQRAFALAAAVLLAGGSLCAPAQAQTLAPSWYQQSPASSPPARYIDALSYDLGHSQAVLFGGFGAAGYLNDTWLWNGTTWSQANPVHSPPTRAAHAMAYDPSHGNVVLFGGLASVSSRLGDTWLWNGTDWTQANPVNSPPARDGAVMVYDAATSQVLLFGGVNGNGISVSDTWVWDGANWTQQNPASSPSPRADYSMVYDAAIGQMVLFGGKDASGYRNDTWVWNGTNWIQQAPAHSPPARYAQGMAYNAAVGLVVMFGGYNGNFLNDTWVYDGTDWTQPPAASGPAGRYASNAMTYDAAHSQVLLFGGLATNQFNDTWEWGTPGNFGDVSVCLPGQASAAQCGQTLALTFNLAANTAFGATQILTQGTAGLDFNAGTGSTCSGTVPGGSCTVNVLFTPLAPGLRRGAVELIDSGGNLLATAPVYGVGQGPAAAIGPGTQSLANTTANYVLNQPNGVAVDAAGDLFISDNGNSRVVKVAANGTASLLGSGFVFPQGLAVDGAGNVFVTDNSLNEVIKVPAGCTVAACQVTVGSGLRAQLGVAVDGPGNLFISDFTGSEVVSVPAGCTSSACQTIVYGGAGTGSAPVGVAVDGAGNLFVADYGLAQVVEVPAGCVSSSCQVKVGQGWIQPEAVAVDAAGDVFVTDYSNRNLVEVPPGCTSISCETTVQSGIDAFGVAVDGQGNVFTTDTISNQVIEVNRSQPPSLSFATTNVGSTSSDSPKSVSLQNIGNLPLDAEAPGLNINGASFVSTPGPGPLPDCSASFALLPAAACNLSLSFKPQSGGNPLTGAAVFSDNALNAALVTQSVALSGTGLSPAYTLTVADIGSGSGIITDNTAQIACVETNGTVTTPKNCTATYPGGTLVTLSWSTLDNSSFTGWGGACASSGTSPTCVLSMTQVLNVSASFVNQNFGNVTVCPPGQNTLSSCSNTLPVTYNLAATTTVGAIEVVTQGATGLDFSLGSGSTCAGIVAGGSACNVQVKFSPRAPGLRIGAVELFDNAANLLATTPIFGVGQEPAIAFGPGARTTIPALGLGANLRGAAVDASGNLYVADYGNNKVVKVTPAGVQTTLPAANLNGPAGLAVDGAGDVFIANIPGNQVVKVTPAGLETLVNTPGFTLSQPSGVAVDGAGNLFIADTGNGRVLEVPAEGGSPLTVGTGLSSPVAVALDGAGNVFIADPGTHHVLKVSNLTQTQVNTTVTNPSALAVDAAGDVYIADGLHSNVVEVTPGGVQTTPSSAAGAAQPYALAVDPAGDVFLAYSNLSSNQLVEINRSQVTSFSFALTNAGATSADSAQALAIQNVGNQPLLGSLSLSLGAGFTQNTTPDCAAAFPLAPGATCTESFSFTPPSATFFSGSATFTDNTLNSSPQVVQTLTLSGTGAVGGVAGTVTVPNVVGQAQIAATNPITGVGLVLGTVTTASSYTVASGSVISQAPAAGTQAIVGSAVNLLVSSGLAQAPSPNPLLLENNYFLTGDYVSAGVTLRGTGVGGLATGSITVPTYTQSATQGVPTGADIVDAFLYWETLENTPTPSSANGTFNKYPITGQQIGSDQASYKDGAFTGTIRAYRADVNVYLPAGTNGTRFGSGTFSVSLPDSGGSGFPLTEGASLVIIYRVLSPNFPLKSVVIYDGAAAPAASTIQVVNGFYDAVGGASGTGKCTSLFAAGGSWNNSVNTSATLGKSDQFNATLSSPGAYAAVLLSTPVNNSDNDGILNAWKTGPAIGDFHAGQPGYYDVKSGSWVGLPGAKQGEKDLFVQLDYMCGSVLANGSCDPTKENLFPSPDASGNDPLAMVQQAFAASGVILHLQIGNAVPETTCTDDLSTNPPQLCQFPNQPGVVGWKNSLEFSKLYPRNLLSCITGGDCTTRFPYGQKDSYHYVLFGHSLAIPAWNTRYGSLTSINVVSGITTIGTVDRGTGINACPSRITISGVLGNPGLNGVYNTTGCADTKTIALATPGVSNWSYPNSNLAEPVIGLTSGTITSISGYSDLGGADSAVTLGLWLTAPNQDMSKRANVLAGTLFHEIGHTLGLSHGGLYYDTAGSYVPTFEGNCKPNYQSVMNYLFQLDLVGPNQSVAFSNQTLSTLNESAAGSVTQLIDTAGHPATYPTSAWYVPYITGSPASPATLHCDGTPLNGGAAYRVDSSVAPITPPWTNGQDLNFIGVLQTQERGFNDLANMDLRQVGATGGEFASLATLLSFGSSVAPLNVGSGGNVVLGSGGTVALGSGGTVTLGSGGNVTLGSGGTITLGSGGNVTLGSGGNVTLGSGGTVTPGGSGVVALGSGGNVTLGSGGTITLGSGGAITLGSGGNVTLGSGGTIALGSGGTVSVPSTGGTYTIDGSGGTITLGSGGNVTLGSGGNVTLGSGGTVALGSGGTVTLGSGGNVTLGSGGTIALGSGGNVTLGSGGNVTLGSGGTIALGSGGTVTLGSGGNVTLGSGGTVTLGSGGNVALGSGGNVTLGSGGAATLGAGGTVTLGSGGNVTLCSGGNVTLGSGGTITLGSGGTVTLGSGGTVTLGSGGTVTLGSGGTPIVIGAGGTVTLGSGGTVTLGSGGNVTLGSGGNVTLGSGGTIALGSGGVVTLGSGGNVTLGSGGVVTLGSGGSVTLGRGTGTPLGTVNNVAPGSGGPTSSEVTYDTANSVVRPPLAPSKTTTPAGVRITWNAPAFGVVQSYTIDRSSNGATPIVIGSVSGVNGFPPATEFTDTNPNLTAQTVVYTVTTTLVPDANGSSRQSPPSPPATLKNDQSITLTPLPSSVTLGNPPTVTAISMSGGVPDGVQVVFSATGSCSIGAQSLASNVSSAAVILNSTGTCTVTASQPGSSTLNAANAVTATFMVLPAGSGILPQKITFAPLQNAQYGASFTLSASSSANLPVSFTASGPCTTSGAISGAGLCSITATAAGNSTYSAASVTQSFHIYPAILKVVATNFLIGYGQAPPPLTYSYSGFVKSDTASVVSGAPKLSTTATVSSNVGLYPITVSTGTLATANYSFLYVNGALIVGPAILTITPDGRKSKTLGATFSAFTGTVTGLQHTDTVTVTYASKGAAAAATVGSYDITVASYKFTAGSALNYIILQSAAVNGLSVLYASAGVCDGDVGHTILKPINANGTSVWPAGTTITTQFRVCDANGNSVGPTKINPNVVTSYALIGIYKGTVSSEQRFVNTNQGISTAFLWDPVGQQWQYNTATGSGTIFTAGYTYLLQIRLADGTVIGSSGANGTIPIGPFPAGTVGFQFGLK